MALRKTRLTLALCAAFAALVLPGASFAATPPAVPGRTTVLSNERTATRSARVVYAGMIRSAPSKTARAVGRLRQLTEDGYPEVYLALRAYTDPDGAEWTKIRVPGRPNGRTGWVQRELLGPFRLTRWQIVVNRKTQRLTLFWNGKKRWRRPVGIGAPGTPTPPGRFWIREKIKVRDKKSGYWPWALGTSNYSTLSEWPGGGVIGIHGDWNQPELIPGRPSHGCIRMRDRDVARLAAQVPVGTPVRILR